VDESVAEDMAKPVPVNIARKRVKEAAVFVAMSFFMIIFVLGPYNSKTYAKRN